MIPSSTRHIKPQARKLHDPDVTFEEYHYYAIRTREEEASAPKPKTLWREIILRKKPEAVGGQNDVDGVTSSDLNFSNRANRVEISDEEWSNASRAFRTASAGACFYLITTDILGPYGVGFAMGTLGWMPGIILYSVFGFMAGYSGYLLWHIFLGLDSHQFPLRNYGDLGFRLYGSWARHILNVLQALALLLILGQVTIQNGQALSQVSKFRICYAVCPIIFIAAGFALGQVRTLRRFGLIANLAIWLNLLVIFITMGIMAHSPPNYHISVLGSAGAVVDPDSITPDANGNYPPVRHYNYLPDPSSLVGSLNGLMSGVLAYGGAQLFIEFMAEMRRPNDFLKAMWGAQFFIYSVYSKCFWFPKGCLLYCNACSTPLAFGSQMPSDRKYSDLWLLRLLLPGTVCIPNFLSRRICLRLSNRRQHDRVCEWPYCRRAIWEYWDQGLVQQRLDGYIFGTSPYDQARKDSMDDYRAHLVVHRVYYRGSHSGLLRFRVRHCFGDTLGIHLLLPSDARPGVRYPVECRD